MRFVSGPARTGWLLVFAFACASGGCEDDEHCSAPLVCADEGCKSFVDRVGTARFGFRTFAVYGCGQYTVVADRQGGEGGVRHFFYSDAETLAGVFYDGAGVAADFRDWLDDRDVDTEKMQGCNAIWEGEEVECVPTCAHSGYGGLAEQLGLDPCEEDGPDECRLPKLCPCDTYEERLASLEAQSRGQHCSQEGECYEIGRAHV